MSAISAVSTVTILATWNPMKPHKRLLPRPLDCCTFLPLLLPLPLPLSLICIPIISLSLSLSLSLISIPMEQYSQQDNKEPIKDKQREGHCKEACDIRPSKRLSDDFMPHILNLYGSCATPRDFEIYAPDATFEDPLMCAHGIKQIKSAFYSLSKVFAESKIVEYTIKENVISPTKQELLIDNKQYYKFLGKDINMISLIKLYVEEGKIVRHEDWWDKKPLWNKETVNVPLVGRIVELSRRGSMLATHAMMRFGKDPTT